MDKELAKSLVSLIDETIAEIEDLKKSRFSASEVNMAGPSGVAAQPANGSIDKKEDEDEDEEEDTEKAEGKNSEADPGSRGPVAPEEASIPPKSSLHEEAEKAEEDEEEEDEDEEEAKKAEGKNSEADPGSRGPVAPEEASVPSKSSLHAEAKKSREEEDSLKKSLDEQEALMKSYVDSKIDGLEKKLESIFDLVKEIGDKPVERKGVPAAAAVPLKKSEESEDDSILSKSRSEIANKLFDLKKSGEKVDSGDIAMVETGSGDLRAIVQKYGLN
jgi:hypothetical protein